MKQGIRVNQLSRDYKMMVNIKVTRQIKLRIWIGSKLIKLAALAFGCSIELKNADTREFA